MVACPRPRTLGVWGGKKNPKFKGCTPYKTQGSLFLPCLTNLLNLDTLIHSLAFVWVLLISCEVFVEGFVYLKEEEEEAWRLVLWRSALRSNFLILFWWPVRYNVQTLPFHFLDLLLGMFLVILVLLVGGWELRTFLELLLINLYMLRDPCV